MVICLCEHIVARAISATCHSLQQTMSSVPCSSFLSSTIDTMNAGSFLDLSNSCPQLPVDILNANEASPLPRPNTSTNVRSLRATQGHLLAWFPDCASLSSFTPLPPHTDPASFSRSHISPMPSQIKFIHAFFPASSCPPAAAPTAAAPPSAPASPLPFASLAITFSKCDHSASTDENSLPTCRGVSRVDWWRVK